MHANHFEATETLKNGATVTIRAIRPTDKAGMVEAFARLEPDSVFTRFFQHKQSLTDRELIVATEVDFENVVALVVTTESGGREVIIGGGRYLILDPARDQRSAEVAFLVEEDYHGQGLAGRILRHLAAIAREQGVSQFEAEVLARNKAMLAVFSRSGLPMKQNFADGVTHVTLSLTERPPPP
ncbi:MAG: GNAT family N-acetyltransferase [Verrucomicrobia bacterium]|nr:GNAT family N-acetyltransferase [Verrucomicrobiota bacterium]